MNDKLPVLVTGATGAIGTEIARGLSSHGERLIIACRSREKGEKLLSLLAGEGNQLHSLLLLDLADPESVTKAIHELKGMPLKGIVNVAGIMCRDYRTDSRGEELTIAVSCRATMRLSRALLPQVADGGVIVFTTSLTRFMGPRKGYSLKVDRSSFSQLATYGLSKKALTDAAMQLAAENPRLRIVCFDPGIVDTGMISLHRWFDPLADIFFRPFIRSPRKGAMPAIRAFYGKETGRIYTLRRGR